MFTFVVFSHFINFSLDLYGVSLVYPYCRSWMWWFRLYFSGLVN